MQIKEKIKPLDLMRIVEGTEIIKKMSKKGGRRAKKQVLDLGTEQETSAAAILQTYVDEKKGVKTDDSSDIYRPNISRHEERPRRDAIPVDRPHRSFRGAIRCQAKGV